MALHQAAEFGEHIAARHFAALSEPSGSHVGDVAGSPSPSPDLQELSPDSTLIALGQDCVLIDRQENRIYFVFAVIAEIGPPELMAIFDDSAYAPKLSVY